MTSKTLNQVEDASAISAVILAIGSSDSVNTYRKSTMLYSGQKTSSYKTTKVHNMIILYFYALHSRIYRKYPVPQLHGNIYIIASAADVQFIC
jgi:hypothetical protein